MTDSENTVEGTVEKFLVLPYVSTIYEAFIACITSGEQRRGQAWMNALWQTDPDLYDEVSGTDADCFYDDHRIDIFKARVFGEEDPRCHLKPCSR